MSNLCPDLATKEELASLEKQTKKELNTKVATAGVPNIIGQALAAVPGIIVLKTSGILNATVINSTKVKDVSVSVGHNAANIANVKSAVNTNAVNIGNANSQALNATIEAKKVRYQNLYNASRTASNANKIASVGKQTLRALNLVANVYSILSSFATTAALAYLTKQVAKLNEAVILNTKNLEQNRVRSIENGKTLAKQQNQIQTINQTLRVKDAQYRELAHLASLQRIQIAQNTSDLADFKTNSKQQIESLKNQYRKQIDSLTQSNSELQKKVTQANKDIQQLETQVNSTNLEVQSFKQQTDSQVTNDTQKLIKETVEKEVNENVRIRNLNDKVTNYDLDLQSLKSNSKDLESSIKARDLEVIKQAKDLERRVDEIKNNEVKTQTLVDQIRQKDNQVDQKQVQDINLKLDKLDNKISNFPSPTTIALAVGGLDILRQIKDNSSKSTCQAPTLVPPVATQAKANGAAVLTLQGINTAQNTAIQRTTDLIQTTVSNGAYGLKAIKNAADIAWKATHADKALQMLNTVVVISNAISLGLCLTHKSPKQERKKHVTVSR